MSEEVVPRILYSDSANEVAVTDESVMLSDAHGIVLMSRFEFAEVVAAWRRMLEQESEAKP